MKKQLMLVAMLSVGTALTTMGRLKPVAASLTPPTVYDYSYTWNATDSEQYLNVNGVDSIPLYTRTVDGSHFDYVSTFNVIDGLEVTMDFQRSNTTWQASGTKWKPDENRIGSDNTVGSVLSKVYLKFDNQTKYDYQLYLDQSSGIVLWYVEIDDVSYFANSPNDQVYFYNANLNLVYVPAYSKIELFTANTSGQRYFDAWYLKSRGLSDAWQQGYDADTQGILTDYLGTDAQQIGWVLIGIAAILFAFKGGK